MFMVGKWYLGGEGFYFEDYGFDINIGGYEVGGFYFGGYFVFYGNLKMKEGLDGENLFMCLVYEIVLFIEIYICWNKKQFFFVFFFFYVVYVLIEIIEVKWRYFWNKVDLMGIVLMGFEVDCILFVCLQQDNFIYVGLIQQMDDVVGVVFVKLYELGLDENMIIVFISDNGGVFLGDVYVIFNYFFCGGKGWQWEGGICVLLFIDFLGNILKGDLCVVFVIGVDLYFIFFDMVGILLMFG